MFTVAPSYKAILWEWKTNGLTRGVASSEGILNCNVISL